MGCFHTKQKHSRDVEFSRLASAPGHTMPSPEVAASPTDDEVQGADSVKPLIHSEASVLAPETHENCTTIEHMFPLVTTWHTVLPSGSYDEGVGRMAHKLIENNVTQPLALQCAVGPCNPMLFKITILQWSLFAAAPWVIRPWVTCKGDDVEAPLLWTWCIALLPLLVARWIENQCFRYAVIPIVQTSGELRCLFSSYFPEPPSYSIVLGVMNVVSFMGQTDLVCNSVFLAVTMATRTCQSGEERECLWQQVMKQSIFGAFLPASKLPPFWSLALALWSFMLVQPVVGLLAAMPLPYALWPKDAIAPALAPVSYAAKDEDYALFFAYGSSAHGTMYPTWLRPRCLYAGDQHNPPTYLMDHGSAMFVLAEANRFELISSCRAAYSARKAHFYLSEGKHGPAIGIFRRELRSCEAKFIMKGLLQGSLALNIQVTMLGIIKITSHGKVDSQLFLTVTLSFFLAWLNLVDGVRAASAVYGMFQNPMTQEESGGLLRDEIGLEYQWLRHEAVGFAMLLLVYFVALLYATCKLIALWACGSYMFNIGGCPEIGKTCLAVV